MAYVWKCFQRAGEASLAQHQGGGGPSAPIQSGPQDKQAAAFPERAGQGAVGDVLARLGSGARRQGVMRSLVIVTDDWRAASAAEIPVLRFSHRL